jgi:predicted nucleotidyltransferase
VQRAEEAVSQILRDIDALALEMQEKLSDLAVRFDPEKYELETVNITPRHSDIFNVKLHLVWEPVLNMAGLDEV